MVSMDHKTKPLPKNPDLEIFIRNVRDIQGKKRTITVRPWATVKDVKDILQQLILIPANAQRLYYGPLLTSGKELPNHRTLYDAGIDCSGKTILLDLKDVTQSPSDSEYSMLSLVYASDICISSSMYDMTSKPLRSLVQHARNGLAIGLKPNLALEGSGGTYFMHDSRKNPIAVFKPADEEPYADNNPRGYIRSQPGDSLRKGIAPGEACIREVAAFLLDHGNFSGVPMTTLVEARHPAFNTNGARLNLAQGGASVGSHSLHLSPGGSALVSSSSVHDRKPGSFQEFIKCEFSMDDISPTKISIDEVHKIAILDIRIMNADRNAANLVVRRNHDGTLALVPIDHGYCLRSVCDLSWMDWCWLDWPQLKQPPSERTKRYVKSLNIEADAQLLKERLNICEEAVDYFRASSALLKAGVAAGLSLYDIAIMCCRNDDLGEAPSMMEKLFDMACELAQVAVENERWHHTAASRAIEEQLSHLSVRSLHPGFRKSSSSVEFTTLPKLEADVVEDSPGLVKSSASDTSSDSDDNEDEVDEKEDCENWAKQVIADVNVQATTTGRPFRSGSVSSSSSEEGSTFGEHTKGFWHVSPGFAVGKPVIDSDESSIAWSLDNQTNQHSLLSLDDHDALSDNEDLQEAPKKSRVSFLLPETKTETFRPPSTVSVASVVSRTVPKVNGGMIRSRSFAGQLDKKGHASLYTTKNTASLGRSSSASEDNHKKYFHKFIDLVIVRETKAALHQAHKLSKTTKSSST